MDGYLLLKYVFCIINSVAGLGCREERKRGTLDIEDLCKGYKLKYIERAVRSYKQVNELR